MRAHGRLVVLPQPPDRGRRASITREQQRPEACPLHPQDHVVLVQDAPETIAGHAPEHVEGRLGLALEEQGGLGPQSALRLLIGGEEDEAGPGEEVEGLAQLAWLTWVKVQCLAVPRKLPPALLGDLDLLTQPGRWIAGVCAGPVAQLLQAWSGHTRHEPELARRPPRKLLTCALQDTTGPECVHAPPAAEGPLALALAGDVAAVSVHQPDVHSHFRVAQGLDLHGLELSLHDSQQLLRHPERLVSAPDLVGVSSSLAHGYTSPLRPEPLARARAQLGPAAHASRLL